MIKNILFTIVFIISGLSTQSTFSQVYYPNCGSVNCTTSNGWQYLTDWILSDFLVSETTMGIPPITVPCIVTVHVDFRWRICDGKYEFELYRFWWDFSKCPIDYNDPNFLTKMKALHERLYPALVLNFYRERLNQYGFNDIICPPYCCPNNFVSISMSTASCFLFAIEWDEGDIAGGGGTHHSIKVNALNGIEFYLSQVPIGATPYISIENCQVTTCCTKTYKICRNGTIGELSIQEDVQPPPIGTTVCSIYPSWTCFPRCE